MSDGIPEVYNHSFYDHDYSDVPKVFIESLYESGGIPRYIFEELYRGLGTDTQICIAKQELRSVNLNSLDELSNFGLLTLISEDYDYYLDIHRLRFRMTQRGLASFHWYHNTFGNGRGSETSTMIQASAGDRWLRQWPSVEDELKEYQQTKSKKEVTKKVSKPKAPKVVLSTKQRQLQKLIGEGEF